MELKNGLIETLFAHMKSLLEALEQKPLFGTQNEDRCTRSIIGIYRMTPFLGAYFPNQKDLPYLTPVDSSLYMVPAFLKRLDEEVVESQP